MIVKLSFPAGKMLVENLKVKPDLRKGKIQLTVDESECSHFQWLPDGCDVEDDFIIFPGEFSFSKVVQSKSRVFLLEFQGERYFYWMQGPDSSKDLELCAQVNQILMPKPEEPKIDTSGLAKILESFGKIQKIPDIEEILNPEALKSLLNDLENDQELISLLPEEQRTKEKMRENLLSPQLQHAMQVLSEAIRSPGGSAIFASVGLQDSHNPGTDPLERFLRALQSKVDQRGNFK
jgi:hypothetical protein